MRGLARSFDYLPPGHFSLTWPAIHTLFEFAAGMWVAGLQIAAPVLVASLFADVALGFIGKASPQLPVLFVGISIKNLLGLALSLRRGRLLAAFLRRPLRPRPRCLGKDFET